jgi:hypothetical protein
MSYGQNVKGYLIESNHELLYNYQYIAEEKGEQDYEGCFSGSLENLFNDDEIKEIYKTEDYQIEVINRLIERKYLKAINYIKVESVDREKKCTYYAVYSPTNKILFTKLSKEDAYREIADLNSKLLI